MPTLWRCEKAASVGIFAMSRSICFSRDSLSKMFFAFG
jgi:hypothetical protein